MKRLVESKTSYTPVVLTVTAHETIDGTLIVSQTDIAEVTASISVQEMAQDTETAYVTETTTSTETISTGPTATVTLYQVVSVCCLWFDIHVLGN